MNILRIDTAVTGEASVSRELTQAITQQILTLHPDAEVTE